LILATPTAMVAALSAAARLGILVKDVADLEAAGRIDAMILDKTGTLTTGELGVSRLAPRDGVTPSELLYASATAEQLSKHPAALALQRLAGEAVVTLGQPESLNEEPGQGIEAVVDGDTVLVGRASWLQAKGIDDPRLAEADASATEEYSAVFVARAGDYLGWIGMQDQIRPEAKATLDELRELKIRRVAMVSGDREAVARDVAEQIGCREFKAQCLPQEKVDYVRQVQEDGYRVAVVGDGVNDAPALAAGDTGIAMGAAGSDVAIHSASVALMSNDLQRLPFLVRLSRSARTVIQQNLGVGVIFIVGGLYFSSMGKLNPILAAFLHNVGSLVVVFNSARLIREGEEIEAAAHDKIQPEAAAAVMSEQPI
jgi:Cd2+/Zn2+-exporting ATPase